MNKDRCRCKNPKILWKLEEATYTPRCAKCKLIPMKRFILGIVGAESRKFSKAGRIASKEKINEAFERYWFMRWLTSGHCPKGGVDIWSEKIAKKRGRYAEDLIFEPEEESWDGYKPRNIQIAEAAHVVLCIAPRLTEPSERACYHCRARGYHVPHIVNGGCWTARHAMLKLGKPIEIILVDNLER